MGILIEMVFFVLPFLAYLLWWRLAGRKPGHEPSKRLIGLAAVGVACGLMAAVYYGLSRSLNEGGEYVPARIEGGEITRGHER